MTAPDQRCFPSGIDRSVTGTSIVALLGVRPGRIAGVDSVARDSQRSKQFDFHRLRPWHRSLIEAIRKWLARVRHRRRARRDLERLIGFDERLLADVGLTRRRVWMALRSGETVDVLLPPADPARFRPRRRAAD